MTQEYVAFSKILSEIKTLYREKATGTIYLVTPDNRSAQLMLNSGEIVYVLFAGKRGQDAIYLLSLVSEARFRFQQGGSISRYMELPETKRIIEIFEKGEIEHTPSLKITKNEAQKSSGLSAEQKDVVESCLAECIGPMATIICEDCLGSVRDLSTAIEMLSKELPSQNQVDKFRNLLEAKLNL
jgi:hypothetical protein